jgi:hypothetical protein
MRPFYITKFLDKFYGKNRNFLPRLTSFPATIGRNRPPPPQQQQQQYFQQEHFAEGGMPKNEMGFSDVTIRARFVRKVFLMVTLMVRFWYFI